MDDHQLPADETQEALIRREEILSAITHAAERFLWAPATSWPQTVQEVISELGTQLKIKRIFLCKHQEVTAEHVITGLRYEWVAVNVPAKIQIQDLQQMEMQQAGFGRWAGLLYDGGIIHEYVKGLPQTERGAFLSDSVQSIIIVPVYVGQQWWGFIGFEDYVTERRCSPAELDAFKTVAVTFGAAIRRKRAEEALNQEKAKVEEKAREIEDIARFPAEDPSPVLRLAQTGEVKYANRAAEPLMQTWKIQAGQPVPADWQEVVDRVFTSGASEAVDVPLAGRILSLLVVPVSGEKYVNVYGRDVTRERELDRMKSEFISMVSHQLRSPITSIRWYSERFLKKGESLTLDQREMAKVIHDTSAQLAGLIDDLLSLSRMERGTLVVEPGLSDMGILLEEVLTEEKGLAERKQIQLNLVKSGELSPFMFDKKLIREVILNLLSNAIKYTPQGGQVIVRVTAEPETALVEVVDTGMGIKPADQDKIFNRFFRSQNVVDLGVEGTGLGLSVAKLIIEKSGGTIDFNSTEGQGSTFYFRLPRKLA
jgi:signal transduction histidine kinase